MIEKNLKVLNSNEVLLNKWEKHYISIKISQEDLKILSIFENYYELGFI